VKWFKHFTDASDDEFIAELENRFGLAGYGRWWKLLEIVGGQFKKDGPPKAAYPWSFWRKKLKVQQKPLEVFLTHLGDRGKIKTREVQKKLKRSSEEVEKKLNFFQNILEIEIPKLLEIRDEYNRKSGHTPDPFTSTSASPCREGFMGSNGDNSDFSGDNPKGVKKGGDDERFN